MLLSTSLRAQTPGAYVLTDTSGHIVDQFYYKGIDSLPPRAHSLTGLTDVQLQNKSFLKWQNSAWVYSGPLTPAIPPDPNIAKLAALKAAGFTAAQANALILIFGQ